MTKRIIFDVESVGLHGEGFAVGWVVLNDAGQTESQGHVYCDPRKAVRGVPGDREWVEDHVVPGLEAFHITEVVDTPFQVREAFWKAYQAHKEEGPVELWADCPWPVEANFLTETIDFKRVERNWQGPYPLLDVGVMLRAAGIDPMATFPRLDHELPVHNALADARQSARLLLEAENALAGYPVNPAPQFIGIPGPGSHGEATP